MHTCMKKYYFPSYLSQILGIFLAFLFPTISYAVGGENVNTLLNDFGKLIYKAVPITFALALLFFFYGIAKFIYSAGDVGAKAEGKSIMVYGVIAIAVMASIWGIIHFIGTELRINPLHSIFNSI